MFTFGPLFMWIATHNKDVQDDNNQSENDTRCNITICCTSDCDVGEDGGGDGGDCGGGCGD